MTKRREKEMPALPRDGPGDVTSPSSAAADCTKQIQCKLGQRRFPETLEYCQSKDEKEQKQKQLLPKQRVELFIMLKKKI